jgi:protocatechuate 3,4-dioxygenase beta subunit
MNSHPITLHRRQFLHRAMLGSAAFFTVAGAFAEQLVRTPRMTEGPFYPDKLPLDTDNDLVRLSNSTTPAIGQVTHLKGRILGPNGAPFRNAVIEIWQCDNNGAYLHSRTGNRERRDVNFQGFGRFETGSKGEYYFRTIKPVPYPGRTPHIHVIVKKGEKKLLTTQLYVKGEPQNERDGIFRSIRDAKARESVLVDFTAMPGSTAGELTARFDIVLGMTPETA